MAASHLGTVGHCRNSSGRNRCLTDSFLDVFVIRGINEKRVTSVKWGQVIEITVDSLCVKVNKTSYYDFELSQTDQPASSACGEDFP